MLNSFKQLLPHLFSVPPHFYDVLIKFLSLQITVMLDLESSVLESTVHSAASFYELFQFILSLIFQLSQFVAQTSEKVWFASAARSSTAAAG